MKPGDTFKYRGPAWDLDANGPEQFVDGTASNADEPHMLVIADYNHFIVASEIRWPDEQYVIPKTLGTISNHTPAA